MQAALNPFNPGSGLKPPALVGRDAELKALEVTVQRACNGLAARGIVLTGLRGVGKTVLLNEMLDRVEAAGWFVVSIEARGDNAGGVSVRHILAREITAQARRLSRRKGLTDRVRQALQSVAAFNLRLGTSGIDLGVEIVPGRADSGDIEVDLPELVQDLSAALREQGSAFGLFIDEMQDLDADLLRALLVTQHHAGQRAWPFYIVGAGLPHLPAVLAEARSYAERLFDYRSISRLSEPDATDALADPVRPHGVGFEADALAALLAASDGYPYFLQEYGRAAWEVADGPAITIEDAKTSVVIGLDRLELDSSERDGTGPLALNGAFSSLWQKTRTPRPCPAR